MKVSGRVISAIHGAPVDLAIVHDTRNAITTGPDGLFELDTDQGFVTAEAVGFYSMSMAAAPNMEFVLAPDPAKTTLPVVEVLGKIVKKRNIWPVVIVVIVLLLFAAWKYKWIG